MISFAGLTVTEWRRCKDIISLSANIKEHHLVLILSMCHTRVVLQGIKHVCNFFFNDNVYKIILHVFSSWVCDLLDIMKINLSNLSFVASYFKISKSYKEIKSYIVDTICDKTNHQINKNNTSSIITHIHTLYIMNYIRLSHVLVYLYLDHSAHKKTVFRRIENLF